MTTGKAMEHRGYLGSIEADVEEGVLYGSVQGIRDVVHYEGKTLAALRKAFRASVDEYLKLCEERDEEPDKPFSGKFVARVGESLHRHAASTAAVRGMSLNDLVVRSLERELAGADSSSGKNGR